MTSSSTCIVYPCRRRGGFRLPLDPDLRLRWLEAIRWPIVPLEPKKTATVCPTHFTENDFAHREGQPKILKNDAIPSVFPWNSSLWSKEEIDKNAGSRPPSADEEQEVDKVEVVIDKNEECSKGSPNPASAESLSDDSNMVADVEILSISSDGDAKSQGTGEDSGLSCVTFWEPSPAGREPVKRPAPSSSSGSGSSQNGGKRRKLGNSRCSVIVMTSKGDSRSSGVKDSPKEENPDASVAKDEDGADSDGSDCILCEKPIESIDLTADTDDTVPEPRVASFSLSSSVESDSSKEEALLDDESSESESLPPPLSNKEVDESSVSEDSDCAIIEEPPPTIEINSDDESDRSRTPVLTKKGNETYGQVAECKEPPVQEFDPFAGITNRELEPFAGVPSDPAIITFGPSTSPPVASSRSNLSPAASKDPNASSVQKSVPAKKTVRCLSCDRADDVIKENTSNGVAPGKLPREYEVVGIYPGSKTVRIVLSKKKKTPKLNVPDETQGSVDPVTARLHDVPGPSRVNSKNGHVVISTTQVKNVRIAVKRDLVREESQLESVALHCGEKGFEPHCDMLSRKLVEIIRKSRVMVGKLSQEAILSTYNFLFLSEISYGVIYWGHCEGAHNIFDLQKRFVAMMAPNARAEVKASRVTFTACGVLTLPSIYILHCLIHVHKNLDTVIKRVNNHFKDTTGRSEVKIIVPKYEIQGLEFYMALPDHLHKPHCALTEFISIVKKFLKRTAPFNALEYYDMVICNAELLV